MAFWLTAFAHVGSSPKLARHRSAADTKGQRGGASGMQIASR
jgi:hypothetical protein